MSFRGLWNGSVLEAIDKFMEFWNGSGPQDPLPAGARLRMIERAHKLAFDFTAAFTEENVAIAAASLRVPTLLFSGGLSPYVTQRIVQRLGAIMDGAEIRHLPAAGHMLRSPMRRRSIPRSCGTSPARTNSQVFRWRESRRRRRPSAWRKGDVLGAWLCYRPSGIG